MAILELEDFSGGITDYYLNAPQNKLKTCDNLLLDFYPTMGKPSTRPGSKLYSSTAPQVPTAQRINTCFYYKDILYVQSGQKLFYFKDGAWVEVYAPLSASAFIGATTSVYFNYSHWNYHTLISGSDYMYPKKVIHGENGVPYVVEAGLPRYAGKPTIKPYLKGTVSSSETYGKGFFDTSTKRMWLVASDLTLNIPKSFLFSAGALSSFNGQTSLLLHPDRKYYGISRSDPSADPYGSATHVKYKSGGKGNPEIYFKVLLKDIPYLSSVQMGDVSITGNQVRLRYDSRDFLGTVISGSELYGIPSSFGININQFPRDWPYDYQEYKIYFESDNYATGYDIYSRAGEFTGFSSFNYRSITISGSPGNVSQSRWMLKRKNPSNSIRVFEWNISALSSQADIDYVNLHYIKGIDFGQGRQAWGSNLEIDVVGYFPTEYYSPDMREIFPFLKDAEYYRSANTENRATITSLGNTTQITSSGSGYLSLSSSLGIIGMYDWSVNHYTGEDYNFLYKLVYRHNYKTLGSVSFVDVGTPSEPIQFTGKDNVSITNIAPLAGGSFDIQNTFIDIYRTEHNGTIFYKAGSIRADETSFTLGSSYQTSENNPITANESLYTTGEVVENDRPPRCLTVHVKGDIAYYGNIIDSVGDKINYRVIQSIPSDIDSVPESFYVDLDDEVICISSTRNNVIVLCRRTSYRLDGQFDELGRGGISFERISDTAGCISPQGAVQALDGVFWLGQEGVYFTDGFKVIRINTDYDKSYRSFITSNGGVTDDKSFRLQGKYDRKKNRVWWAMSKDNGLDLDFCYVLDLNWGISEKSTFTTVSGDSFAPSAIEFVDGNLIRCDKRGYIFQHQDNYYSDVKIDTSLLPSAWREETIRYNLETSAFSFGTSGTRKYVTQANVTCTGTTNVSLQIISNNDDGKVVSELNPIRFRGNVDWDADIYWGDTSLFWNRKGMVHEKRRMPAKSLRCNVKSIQITNAKVAIISSALIGNIVINPELKIVTLLNGSSSDWPLRSVGYFIAFEQDGYQEEFEILERSSDTLRYLDPNGVILPSSNSGWVIRGYPQGEVLNLLNMSLVYEFSGPTLSTFRTAGTGEVG